MTSSVEIKVKIDRESKTIHVDNKKKVEPERGDREERMEG